MKTVVGLFEDIEGARSARADLLNAGLVEGEIDTKTSSDFGPNIIDELKDKGVPDSDSQMLGEGIRRGYNLVVLTCADENVDRVADILEGNNAVDLDRLGHFYEQQGFKQFEQSATRFTDNEIRQERLNFNKAFGEGEMTVPVTEEKAKISKQAVPRGRMRIFTRILERPVEERVNLREEHVDVERKHTDRPLMPGEMEAFKEGTIEIPEVSEEPVVSKEARVVEEVRVRKTVEEHPETIRTTERRHEVEAERIDDRSAPPRT